LPLLPKSQQLTSDPEATQSTYRTWILVAVTIYLITKVAEVESSINLQGLSLSTSIWSTLQDQANSNYRLI
jgi:hypothetical protein